MKHKIILALSIVTSLLLLSSCGEESKLSDNNQEPIIDSIETSNEFNGEMTISFYFGDRSGIYSGRIDSEGLPDGEGTFSASNSKGTTWTYSGDWTHGHWESYGTTKWEDGSSYEGGFSKDCETGQGVFTDNSGVRYEGSFVNRTIKGIASVFYTDGTHFEGEFEDYGNAVGTFFEKNGDAREAYIKDGILTLVPLTDFFMSEDRQVQYEELYQEYRYKELLSLCVEYIEETSPDESDNVYSIIDLIEPLVPYEEKWIITQDNFDGKYIWSYSDVNYISDARSISVSVKGTDKDIKVGFRKGGWLFFDSIELSEDGNRVYGASVKSYNVMRNVINGSTIEEYCFCDFYEDVLRGLVDADSVIIRFQNTKSQETYDHVLAQDEIDALYCSICVQLNNRDLSNLLYRYLNQK